ncbi:hypothetical protein [Oscillatoria sp. FACHB-1406]|nr:hypothetical protein [Oscillatoria sp. FACHB-1406]
MSKYGIVRIGSHAVRHWVEAAGKLHDYWSGASQFAPRMATSL